MSSTQATPYASEIDEQFRELAEIWKSECGPSSSAVEMAMHPAYQRIIGIGPEVIPCLLKALLDQPDHWFWALRAVTGEDPVPELDRGRVPQMRQAWIDWGRLHGYLPAEDA